MSTASLRTGIVGLGFIGATLAGKLGAGAVPGVELIGVCGRDRAKTAARLAAMKLNVPALEFAELVRAADLVIECAPPALLGEIAVPVLRAGKRLVVVSAGALLANWELLDLAREHGAQLLVPTGALLGLDAVAAAAEGTITSATLATRKPVAGLTGAPYLVENAIDLDGITEPVRVFAGSAREAARGFPSNVNVAVALSLAGIGPDRTDVEVWADPTIARNVHSITVVSDSATFEMRIENLPSANPKTSAITPFSVLALLRKLNGPVWVGS